VFRRGKPIIIIIVSMSYNINDAKYGMHIRLVTPQEYGCISMLRYWSFLRYSSLRTQFSLAADLRRQPTPAHPSQFLLFCWCACPCAGFLSFPALFPCRVSISLAIQHTRSKKKNPTQTHHSISTIFILCAGVGGVFSVGVSCVRVTC